MTPPKPILDHSQGWWFAVSSAGAGRNRWAPSDQLPSWIGELSHWSMPRRLQPMPKVCTEAVDDWASNHHHGSVLAEVLQQDSPWNHSTFKFFPRWRRWMLHLLCVALASVRVHDFATPDHVHLASQAYLCAKRSCSLENERLSPTKQNFGKLQTSDPQRSRRCTHIVCWSSPLSWQAISGSSPSSMKDMKCWNHMIVLFECGKTLSPPVLLWRGLL